MLRIPPSGGVRSMKLRKGGDQMSTEDTLKAARAMGYDRGLGKAKVAYSVHRGPIPWPGPPLSGEWADEPTEGDVLRALAVVNDEDLIVEQALDAYESGFYDGFRETIDALGGKMEEVK